MEPFEVRVTIIASILGLAYPIIITIVSNDKYSSETIISLFDNYWSKKYFNHILITSLLLIVYYYIAPPRLVTFDIAVLNTIIDHSAEILLCLCTVILVTALISMINLIIKIYRAPLLVNYLKKREKDLFENNDFTSFDALSDIYMWGIKNSTNTILLDDLSNYFYSVFRKYREKSTKDHNLKGVVYPQKLYSLIYLLLSEKIENNNRSMRYIENRALGGAWLFGEFGKIKISKNTYQWHWQYLCLAIENGRNEYVLETWKFATQYIRYNLEIVQRGYQYNGDKPVVINKEEVDQSEKERKEYFIFYIALGGLLLYKKKYDVLQEAFTYTQSLPAEYPLLPSHMYEIFTLYVNFSNPYNAENNWIGAKYSFPKFEGADADDKIVYWFCKYVCLLFIRQFHLTTHYIFQNPIEQPILAKSIPDKKHWLENIGWFKHLLNETLKDDSLLKTLNYKNRPVYNNFLNKLRERLKEDLKITITQSELQKEKKRQLLRKSYFILEPIFTNLTKINNSALNSTTDLSQPYYISGRYIITDKEVFLDSGITHLNFDTILAQVVQENLINRVASNFLINSKIKYVFSEETVFSALEKFNLTSEYIIISFGIEDFSHYKTIYNINNLTNDIFNETEIVRFPYSHVVDKSLFLLRRSDLPEVIHETFTDDEKNFYELKYLFKKYNIYYSLSDLSKNASLKELLSQTENKDLSQCLYEAISFRTKFSWKNDSQVVQISFKNSLRNQEKENNIEEIVPFANSISENAE